MTDTLEILGFIPRMKLALITSMVAFALSCGSARFDVNQPLAEQSVEGSPVRTLLGTFVANPFKITVDIKAETNKRNTGPASYVGLKSLVLSITPHGAPKGNFDFLDEVHIFASAPGLAKLEVAKVAPVSKGKASLPFEIVQGINLLPYVNAGAELSATATGHQPSNTVTFDGQIVIEVRI